MKKKIFVGIDPGTIVTGYGFIKVTEKGFEAIDYGCIRPPSTLKLSDRYLILSNSLEELLDRHACDALIVESQYIRYNPASVLKLGIAKGIAIIAAKKRGLPVYEYSPSKAKQAVVGKGNASKQQVQRMMQYLLKLPRPPEPEDAADALALALCHAQSLQLTVKPPKEL